MRYTELPETDAYRAARDELRVAEIELTDHRERVAAMRRSLPAGPVVEDYVLLEASSDERLGTEVRLSSLFSGPGRSLVVYHLMFGKQQSEPCPMCTMWVDGFDAVARHVTQRADFAVVAAAEPGQLAQHARDRGWSRLRLLSAGASSFKRDLGSEDEEGHQDSRISVFTRDDRGVRHFYSSSPHLGRERVERGIDLLCATWELLDLTPEGRGSWYASLSY